MEKIKSSLRRDRETVIQLEGQPDLLARFIQEYQLKNRENWRLFVKQFREYPDDEEKSWKGEYWGKLMRGGCLTWQYTRDNELYAVLEETIRDMLTAQDESGRFSTYSKEMEFQGWDMWCRKYVLLGFLYFCEICKDDGLKREILEAAGRHLDYIIAHVGEGKIDITSTSDLWGGINSSSILEPVVKMYQATGKKTYLDFADYIVARGGSSNGNIFELAYKGELYPYQYPDVKAYELMSCFEGLLLYYQVRGGEKWKTAVCNFARLLRESDITIIGCAGCTHELLDHAAFVQTDPERNGLMQETCVTVTWMKLCAKLLLLTGEAVYADEIEKSAYNALYGSVNLRKNKENGGLPFDSYSPLRANTRARFIGGYQEMENGKFFYGCCAAIGAAGTGLFPNMHLLHSDKGVVLSFYTQGNISFRTPSGSTGRIWVQTRYPYEGTVQIELQLETEEELELVLRIPDFCQWAEYQINADAVQNAGKGYLTLRRLWSRQNQIRLHLDMNPRVLNDPMAENVNRGTRHMAVCYGPIVLARDARIDSDVGRQVCFDPKAFSVTQTEDFGIGGCASFLVRIGQHQNLKMIDYASAGATWNESSRMECWFPAALTEE